MRSPRCPGALITLLAVGLACGAPRLSADASPQSPALAQALEHALAEGWQRLHIVAECRTPDGMASVELFGSGVGIWMGARQFRLTRDELRALLQRFRTAGFAGMSSSYGGRQDPQTPAHAAPRLTCRVALSLDGVSMEVVQLLGGRQSEPLRELALGLLEACQEPGRAGVTAAGLQDGLVRIASRELAPEVFGLVVNRVVEGRSGAAEPSWLMRIDGRHVVQEPGPASNANGTSELRETELVELARALIEAQLVDLPANLYAEHYTDVSVRVLDQEKQIVARQFSGLTPTTHGDGQKRFDRVLQTIQELRERLLVRATSPGTGDGPE